MAQGSSIVSRQNKVSTVLNMTLVKKDQKVPLINLENRYPLRFVTKGLSPIKHRMTSKKTDKSQGGGDGLSESPLRTRPLMP